MNPEQPSFEIEPEYLELKAIRLDDEVFTHEHNHALAFAALEEAHPEFDPDQESHRLGYGYVTTKGRFVDAVDVKEQKLTWKPQAAAGD